MSTLERFNLLSPILDSLDEAWPQYDELICIKDYSTIVYGFHAWFITTSDILYNAGYSTQSVLSRVNSLCSSVQRFKPSEVLLACKACYDELLNVISLKKPLEQNLYVHFKGELANLDTNTDLVSTLVAPINRLLSSVSEIAYYENGCWKSHVAKGIRAIAQYFGFLMKLELDRPDLEAKALEDYIKFESSFPKLDTTNPYLKPLRHIVHEWMHDFRYDGSLARHGNGGVANTQGNLLKKYQNIEVDTTLEYLYKSSEDILGIHRYFPLGAKSNLKRVSRLCFVPKNISKLRTISMEPASLQFVQQGAMRKLYRFFKKHPYLKSRIKLQDQGQNKSFAYHGSITDEYSTADLSAASDSVAYELVKYLTKRDLKLWRWLFCTRSKETLLPNGEKIVLKKFAPMGSALCFPIETLVFSAIAELAVRLGRERGTTQDPITGVYSSFWTVYGDDIILPKGAYNIATDILTSLNFKVNEDKSYNNSPFKESCGGNYFAGVDITPVRWSISFPEGNLTPDSYTALCAKANQAYESSFKLLRTFILHKMGEYGKVPYFVSMRGLSPHIYSPTPTNFLARRHVIKRLQAIEVSYTSIGPSPRKPISDADIIKIDTIAYHEWLRLNEDNKPHNGFIMNREGVFEYVYCTGHNPKSYVQCDSTFKRGKIIEYDSCASYRV